MRRQSLDALQQGLSAWGRWGQQSGIGHGQSWRGWSKRGRPGLSLDLPVCCLAQWDYLKPSREANRRRLQSC